MIFMKSRDLLENENGLMTQAEVHKQVRRGKAKHGKEYAFIAVSVGKGFYRLFELKP